MVLSLVEFIISVDAFDLGLLQARVLLLPTNQADGAEPQPDVAEDKEAVDENRQASAQTVGDHEEPVEQAVGQHGQKQARPDIFSLLLGSEHCHREEIAQDDAEEEVTRHRQQGPKETGDEAACQRDYRGVEDIHDVLQTGKAQAYEAGVDDAVEILIEVFVAPDEYHENEEFAKFLRDSGREERVVEYSI